MSEQGIDEKELRDIEERAAKARPPPWEKLASAIVGHDGVIMCEFVDDEDQEFVRHAREDVPRLVAEVRRRGEAIRVLQEDYVAACKERDEARRAYRELRVGYDEMQEKSVPRCDNCGKPEGPGARLLKDAENGAWFHLGMCPP